MYKTTLGSIRWLVTAMLVLMIGVSSATAFDDVEKLGQSSSNLPSNWTKYIDPQFDFSIDYDPNLEVIPRNDNNGMMSTLTFVANSNVATEGYTDPHSSPVKVEVGMYLVSWNERNNLPTRSLKEWTDRYNQISEVPTLEGQRRVHQSRAVQIDGIEALYEQGESFTSFRYVNIPRGDIVWFIWTNSESETDIAVFDQMINSFKFGENTPSSLNEVYGNDFRHLPLSRNDESTSIGNFAPNFLNPFIVPYTISSSWRSPLNGNNLTATCNSAAHNPNTGQSEFAIDVARPAWTDVYATNTGSVPFAGWNNDGFGLLYKIQNGTQTAYNAHLAGIHFPHWWNWYITKGQLIGWVGSTGNSTGNHLHFEVRQNGTSVTSSYISL